MSDYTNYTKEAVEISRNDKPIQDEKEIWIPVPGYSDYLVSNRGRIMSMRRGDTKILPGSISTDKRYDTTYRMFTLYSPTGNRKTKSGAYWVMLAFVGKTPPGKVILRKDDDTTNDRLDNLYYGGNPFFQKNR